MAKTFKQIKNTSDLVDYLNNLDPEDGCGIYHEIIAKRGWLDLADIPSGDYDWCVTDKGELVSCDEYGVFDYDDAFESDFVYNNWDRFDEEQQDFFCNILAKRAQAFVDSIKADDGKLSLEEVVEKHKLYVYEKEDDGEYQDWYFNSEDGGFAGCLSREIASGGWYLDHEVDIHDNDDWTWRYDTDTKEIEKLR